MHWVSPRLLVLSRRKILIVVARLARIFVPFIVISTVPVFSEQTSSRADADRAHVVSLVERLGSGSFEERSAATMALLGVGKAAIPVLELAVQGEDYETTLRAKALIRVIDQYYFGGLDLRLETSKESVAWDEPFDLLVHLSNRLDVSSRVPMVIRDHSDRDGVFAVTGLLDLADYLIVAGPDGARIDLHTDDLNEDPDVLAAVQHRVDHEVSATVPSRAKVVYRVDGFNRNRARYRLLEKGTYRIRVVYQPQWSDQDLIDAGVGRNESNVVTVEVTTSAPEVVRRSWQPASLTLEREGRDVVARIVNQTDVPMVVNGNLVHGSAVQPYAGIRWFVGEGADAIERVMPNPPTADAERFSLANLRLIQSGKAVDIARLAGDLGLPDGAVVSVSYVNLTNRVWQRDRGAHWPGNPRVPVALQKPLPRGMLVTTLHSNTVKLPKKED